MGKIDALLEQHRRLEKRLDNEKMLKLKEPMNRIEEVKLKFKK